MLILREALLYFKTQGFLVESAQEKMYYYIRDRINLRLVQTATTNPLNYDNQEIFAKPELNNL